MVDIGALLVFLAVFMAVAIKLHERSLPKRL
jgi:hypothetical protein